MMFLKELKKILDFKKSDINFRYCFYVENNNIFHYLKKYIYKKSDKFKVLLFTNEEIFYKKNKNIYSLNIKNKFLNYFFFKNLNVKYVYASTPDLNNSYFVKSKNNCKYIYIQHSPISLINAYNHKAFNNFNAIQTINTHQFLETKLINNKFNLKLKPFKSKYSFLDLASHEKIIKKNLLIAPTWNTDFYKNNIHTKIFNLLIDKGIKFEFRPHPMSLKKNKIDLKKFKTIDLNLDYYVDLSQYSNLITDWSGIYLEFAIINKKKPILINTKKKINNHDYSYNDTITIEEKYRKIIGNSIDQNNLVDCLTLIGNNSENDKEIINRFIHEIFFK